MPPSIQNKIDTHVKVIKQVTKILPITGITVEVAQFDTPLLKNPEVRSAAYQHGEQMGFWNVREYVLYRDHHTCQWCHGKSGDQVLNAHCVFRSQLTGNPESREHLVRKVVNTQSGKSLTPGPENREHPVRKIVNSETEIFRMLFLLYSLRRSLARAGSGIFPPRVAAWPSLAA